MLLILVPFLSVDDEPLDLEVFHQDHRVAIGQRVAICITYGIAHDAVACIGVGVRRVGHLGPFKRAVGAHVVAAIGVGVFQAALGQAGTVWGMGFFLVVVVKRVATLQRSQRRALLQRKRRQPFEQALPVAGARQAFVVAVHMRHVFFGAESRGPPIAPGGWRWRAPPVR